MNKHAIHPLQRPFDVRLTLPGSKSYANRALVCAALAGGPFMLCNCSPADDTQVMLNLLADLGWSVTRQSPAAQDVRLAPLSARAAPAQRIYAGEAGTVARFGAALLAATPGRFELDAGPRMRQRPMAPLLSALRQLGATVTETGAPGLLPVHIEGGTLHGGLCELPGGVSSQFLSALLLAAPVLAEATEIRISGELTSASYVDMTLEVLREFGIPANAIQRKRNHVFRAEPCRLSRPEYSCPPDATGAGYFWAAAAITGGSCVVDGLSRQSAQGDVRMVGALENMGCTVLESRGGLGIRGPAHELRAVSVDMRNMPDSFLSLGVVAAFCAGDCELKGTGNLRHKESDRVAALVAGLDALGVSAHVRPDALIIHGKGRAGVAPQAPVPTFGDHRMAMSFAPAGLAVAGVQIENAGVVAKSFPAFWKYFDSLYK